MSLSVRITTTLTHVCTAVKDKTALLTKSMMAAKNLPHPITTSSDGPKWMRALAAELALRLKDIREDSTLVWPKTLVLHVRRVGQST